MSLELTPEQQALHEDVRQFADEEIRPRAIDLDRNGEYPETILDELGERRLTGLTIPEAYGGRGAGPVELAVVSEELSAALMPVASAVALHLGVAEVIERFGTEAQRERFLPEMATFDRVGALGLSEANAGSDKLRMETTAERDGDGATWTLDGHKQWVTNFLDADEVLTYAKTGPDADAPHNVTAFLVPSSAFEVEEVWETMGARPMKAVRVRLDGVTVSDDRRVGEVGEGYVNRGELTTGVNVPARGVGIARAALDDTAAYVTDREQFDQSIGDFQGVRWGVAEMARRVDSARLLTLRAAHRAARGAATDRAFPAAKLTATEAAVENANDAMQFHGGVGYTTDHHVERYLRDARLLTLAGGPNELHKDSLADAVLGADDAD